MNDPADLVAKELERIAAIEPVERAVALESLEARLRTSLDELTTS